MSVFAQRPVTILPRARGAGGGGVRTLQVQDPAVKAGFNTVQSQLDFITQILREPVPIPDSFAIRDKTGKLVAWFGFQAANNVVFEGGYFANLWVGGADPTSAPFFSDGQHVVIGQNGIVQINDNAGNEVASLGVTLDVTRSVSAASGSPMVVTVAGNDYINGDTVTFAGDTGGTGINGNRIVESVGVDGAGMFRLTDLAGNVINSAGTLGGTVTATRYFAGVLAETIAVGPSFVKAVFRAFADGQVVIGRNGIIQIQDDDGNTVSTLGVTLDAPITVTSATNASPMVVTAPGNTYLNGDTINFAGATGNTNLNGKRIVESYGVDGANLFRLTDLAGNVINGNGALGGTPTATRYYAGGLFQTMAIGASFANFKLRAFADGSLEIKDATLSITSGNRLITIDGTNSIVITNSITDRETEMTESLLRLQKVTDSFSYSQISGFGLESANGTAVGPNNKDQISLESATGGAFLSMSDDGGNEVIRLDVATSALKINGNQVVTSRQTGVTNIGGAAGATYTATEQGLINTLIARVNSLNGIIKAHGLSS